MVATCPTFDSPCLFGRDLVRFKEIVPAWYERQLKPLANSELPWAILYPTDFLPVTNAEQMRAINDFTHGLSKYLEVPPRQISLQESWSKTSPVEEKVLDVFLQNVGRPLCNLKCTKSVHRHRNMVSSMMRTIVSTTSAATMKRRSEGHLMPLKLSDGCGGLSDLRSVHLELALLMHYRGIARLLNKAQRDEALKRFATFRQWFLDEIMQPEKQRAVMILPIERLEPRYRDKPPEIPSVPPTSINVLFISPTLGSPELTVPSMLYIQGVIGLSNPHAKVLSQLPRWPSLRESQTAWNISPAQSRFWDHLTLTCSLSRWCKHFWRMPAGPSLCKPAAAWDLPSRSIDKFLKR